MYRAACFEKLDPPKKQFTVCVHNSDQHYSDPDQAYKTARRVMCSRRDASVVTHASETETKF